MLLLNPLLTALLPPEALCKQSKAFCIAQPWAAPHQAIAHGAKLGEPLAENRRAVQLSWDLVLPSQKCCLPGFQVAPQSGVAGRGTEPCSQGCSPEEHSSSPRWQPCRGIPSLPFPWVVVPGPQDTIQLAAVCEQSTVPLGNPTLLVREHWLEGVGKEEADERPSIWLPFPFLWPC